MEAKSAPPQEKQVKRIETSRTNVLFTFDEELLPN